MRDVSQTQCKDAERSERQSTSKSDVKCKNKTREKESGAAVEERCQRCVKHEREKESKKAPPDMSEWRRARRQRGTKPNQKRRISALSRGLIQQKDGTENFKTVGTAARVHARERESQSEHVKVK